MIVDGAAEEALEEGVLALEVGVEGADDGGAEGAEDPPDVGCGVLGTDVGFEVGVPDGLGLDEGSPRPIDRIGDGDEVGLEVGFAGAAASLFTVELLDDGAGLNTWLTVPPSQVRGFHQVAVEVGVLVVGAAEEGALLGGAVVLDGTLVGVGLTGVDVPDGAPEGDGTFGAGCFVVGAEVGSGVPGVLGAEPALLGADVGAVLGAEVAVVLFAPGFATAVDPGAQEVEVVEAGEALAALATVGTTATPVAARKTAGTPIAVTMRARLVFAVSTRRAASAASSGAGTTARGLFTPPLRERSGASVPASNPNASADGTEPARRARSRASSRASRPAGPVLFSLSLLLALKTSGPQRSVLGPRQRRDGVPLRRGRNSVGG